MENYKLTRSSSIYLDLLRGISAQMVVIGHGIALCSVSAHLREPLFPDIENIAVIIFFLLSGFLISYSTFNKISKNQEYSLKAYFIDRFSRIYTAYLPALVAVFIIDFLSIHFSPQLYGFYQTFNFRTFVGNLFMLQDYPLWNFFPAKTCSNFGTGKPFWTLAIEWWLYLWFGYLVFKIFRSKKMTFFNVVIFAFLNVVPLWNFVAGRGNGLTIYWIWGVGICVFSGTYEKLNISRCFKYYLLISLLIFAIVRLIIAMRTEQPYAREYDTIFVFFLALLLMISKDLFSKVKFGRRTAAIIHFNASYSYTLYLLHNTIIYFLVTHFTSVNKYMLFASGFFISNIIAMIIGSYVEQKLTLKVKNLLKTYLLDSEEKFV